MLKFKDDASVNVAVSNQTTYLPISTNAKKASVIIAGLDHAFNANVHVIPNIENVTYSSPVAAATKPKSEMVSRVTFNWNF